MYCYLKKIKLLFYFGLAINFIYIYKKLKHEKNAHDHNLCYLLFYAANFTCIAHSHSLVVDNKSVIYAVIFTNLTKNKGKKILTRNIDVFFGGQAQEYRDRTADKKLFKAYSTTA